ncbi:MAG: hypothetical protein AAF804_19380 [Bacteroidota bacterium]
MAFLEGVAAYARFALDEAIGLLDPYANVKVEFFTLDFISYEESYFTTFVVSIGSLISRNESLFLHLVRSNYKLDFSES